MSTRAGNKLRHKLWKLVRDLGGESIEIERGGPLVRYAVSKHGLEFCGTTEDVQSVYARLPSYLVVNLFQIAEDGAITSADVPKMYARIQPPQDMVQGGQRVYIHVGEK